MHSGAALIDVMLQFSLNGGTSIHSALSTTAADIWLHELKFIWLIVLILKFSIFFSSAQLCCVFLVVVEIMRYISYKKYFPHIPYNIIISPLALALASYSDR